MTTVLRDYIEAGVDALTAVFPKATIILAGDFSSLNDSALVSRTAEALSLPDQRVAQTF